MKIWTKQIPLLKGEREGSYTLDSFMKEVKFKPRSWKMETI